MPRFRNAAACAAFLSACGCAVVGFVTLPGNNSPKENPSLRSSAAAPAWQARVENKLSLDAQTEAVAETPLSGLSWIGAGLLAGIILAVSTSPAALAGPMMKGLEVPHVPESYPEGPQGRFTGKPLVTPFGSIKDSPYLDQCENNKKFHKRFKDERYKKEKRQKKYTPGSAIWNRYTDKIASINRREKGYGQRLCGKLDGLPRVIATGERGIKGGLVTPAFMFFYITGWIGWAGRSYLTRTRDAMKEINIDVPLAVSCMASGFAFPVLAWQEIVNGELVVPDSEIYRGIH